MDSNGIHSLFVKCHLSESVVEGGDRCGVRNRLHVYHFSLVGISLNSSNPICHSGEMSSLVYCGNMNRINGDTQ